MIIINKQTEYCKYEKKLSRREKIILIVIVVTSKLFNQRDEEKRSI